MCSDTPVIIYYREANEEHWNVTIMAAAPYVCSVNSSD